ncbi:MAG TPA: arginine--tRNA ligase [Ferruginibacter sp.]|nr:arginine--tRNA ligase [Bacteroidota bacterium]MBS1926503.1 arginine--tRNA ligase [Bacteroidota bacterium]MCC6691843.1 arginine--tRNA ligase [Chitinophagaceae bacterium]HMT95932.1 arginine--tRNA ligase [Ferruginibacter sp.]HMU23449.1 arginine--tRNA ligase [Ferruginibacter sp.]
MHIVESIQKATAHTLSGLFGAAVTETDFQVNKTKEEFEGDYTIVLFGLLKKTGKSPDALGNELGKALLQQNPGLFSQYNINKGFLNLTITDGYWHQFLQEHYRNTHYGKTLTNAGKVMVEYSSPNTNKPLHLGHLRNNFLGWSIAEILKFNGYQVIKTCIANDRGIHICKSMVAWQLYANGSTPDSTHTKGDHFVGDYYVLFGTEHNKQAKELVESGMSKEEAEKNTALMKAAQQMLIDWEAGKPEVMDLWKKMNSWVYKGFDETYQVIGSDFDKMYYESETYILGKQLVELGLEKKVFVKKEDGSVWIDLTADGLDEKIVQRKDGTAVYMTQDIGLALEKYKQYQCNNSIYVVGDEQNYHFKVLKLICEKLQIPAAEGIYHLSYGMVELPSGRMKTREGTVVDADDIVAEMQQEAEQKTNEQGKVKDFSNEELKALYRTIGLGALKFFLLRVDPKKRMVFNPEESIDFHGFTGPFIQYNYARIKSVLRKNDAPEPIITKGEFLRLEKELVVALEQFPAVLKAAAHEYNPSAIAVYAYQVAKTFSSFFAEHSIAQAETPEKKQLRLKLSMLTAHVLQNALHLLGIKVPERM